MREMANWISISAIYKQRRAAKRPEIRIEHYCRMRLEKWELNRRLSPFWRFYWNDAPGGKVLVGERSVELTPDVVILVPPFTLFSARLEKGPVNQFFIHFTTGDFPAGVARREYVFSAEPWIGQLTEESTNLGRFEIRMYAILYELLLQIPEEHGDAPASDGLDPRLKQAMTLMNTLPRSECDNAELSRKVGMSLSHFSHLFREQLGVTPQHYLAGQLMERAFYLLTDPTISIPEIAERLGFANRYHFSAFFKQHTKQSPGAWRKANLPLH